MLKITTAKLEEANWDLRIDIHEAKLRGEVISLAESTCIRMIEDIVGVDRDVAASTLRELNTELRALRKQPKSKEQARAIKRVYQQQADIQYLPEYLCLVCKTKAAFKKACKGFVVNGLRYVRLVGTTGGVKQSTVVFVAETGRNGVPLVDELRRRIDNGRDMSKEFVPAKLEAYRALVCSASAPLSAPHGVLVVDDCVTHFKSDYILLKDGETDEPEMSTVINGDVELTISDGFGLMSPELAHQWRCDLDLDYLPAGLCLRNSFCKGMVFCFDFHEFAISIAGCYEIKDIWGDMHDIRDVDLVLTASMLKLWDSYPNWNTYWENCITNGYCFSATKATAQELDHERRSNYQFLQSYHLSDQQIEELVAPTVEELTGAMGGDYAKTMLFLRGTHLTDETAWEKDVAWSAALMVNEQLLDDPYIRNQLKKMVLTRINEAKFGKLVVSGNFSVMSGDPYALCESMWGLPVKGLLCANEIYNKYWVDKGRNEIAAFRAPMSSHHNIRKLKVNKSWNVSHWFQYMDTVTILNAWDMTCHALNGADFDGDLCYLTDDRILVNNVRDVLPIQCEQKKAPKCVPTEKDFIEANALGFGDKIGSVTNRITAATELQSLFLPESDEYKELNYRIISGQHQQQCEIDRLKGVVAKPMPKHWYDDDAASDTGDPVDIRVCASKKPYFMIYRYPDLKKQYSDFRKTTNRRYAIQYGRSLEDDLVTGDFAPGSEQFVEFYNRYCPVQKSRGVINRICALCEEKFASRNMSTKLSKKTKFDTSILKSGATYGRTTKDRLAAIQRDYMDCIRELQVISLSDQDYAMRKLMIKDVFQEQCALVCPNEDELCDAMIDICYKTEKSKQCVWDLCGLTILKNLLIKSDGIISYYCASKDGEVEYRGKRFTRRQISVKDENSEGNFVERKDTSRASHHVWRTFQ